MSISSRFRVDSNEDGSVSDSDDVNETEFQGSSEAWNCY